MISQMQEKTIQVNGTELTYIERGAGDPVVFVHGGTVDFRSWMGQVEPFSQRYRVSNFSLPVPRCPPACSLN